MRLPITLIIPLLLVVLTALIELMVYKNELDFADKNIRSNALSDLKLDITRLQNILYNSLTGNKIADARVNLSVTAMNPSISSLVLTDDKNNIIVANRYIWTNSDASSVTDYDNNTADKVKNNNQSIMYFDEKQNYILKGYYPVVLELENKTNLYKKKLGVLYAEVNIKNKLASARNAALNQSSILGMSMLMIALLVALLLHLLISRRLNTLAQISENIAGGNFDVDINISGNDEITHLATSLKKMIHHIKDAFNLRDASKVELMSLNESLEKRVNERTLLLQQAQDIAKIGNWVWNIPGNSLFWSDQAFVIFGQDQEKFTPSIEKLFNLAYSEDISLVESAIENAFINNKKYKIEYRVVWPDGSLHWIREEAVPECDNEGRRTKLIGVVQDITKEKHEEKEKEKLEHEIRQMQKMESLGQLTGGIAHDFNNMLAIIRGYADLSQGLAKNINNEKLVEYLQQIDISSKRATELVSQMLAFSRSDTNFIKKENISVNNTLSEISLMLKPILSSNIKFNILNVNEDYRIYSDVVMLSQIIMNLCVNAKDSMINGQGHIDIEVSKVTLDNKICASCFNSITGSFVQIKISDDGTGMSEEKMYRIFEPFFTTKDVGKGTGMGLSMVHGLMHKQNGHIVAESKEGLGSSFKLLFPSVIENSRNVLNNEVNIIPEEADKNQGNILVVDDEAAIAIFMKEYLQEKGYTVHAIYDSKEALEYFIKNNKSIDLVITDYTMPGMTGLQLAEYILTCRSDMPILMCSGYSENVSKDKVLSMNIEDYIEKPLDTTVLLKAIKKHINNI